MAVNDGSVSGLSEAEAKEFHGVFQTSFVVFVVVAVVAHIMAWMWRPWLPSENGYAALNDTTTSAVHAVVSMLT